MAQNVTLYNLLISCPGDIKKEVTLIEAAVDEFNELYAENLGITIRFSTKSRIAPPQMEYMTSRSRPFGVRI